MGVEENINKIDINQDGDISPEEAAKIGEALSQMNPGQRNEVFNALKNNPEFVGISDSLGSSFKVLASTGEFKIDNTKETKNNRLALQLYAKLYMGVDIKIDGTSSPKLQAIHESIKNSSANNYIDSLKADKLGKVDLSLPVENLNLNLFQYAVKVEKISKEEFDKIKPNILTDYKPKESVQVSNDEKDTTAPRQVLYVYDNMTQEDKLLVSKAQANVFLDVDINPLSRNKEYKKYVESTGINEKLAGIKTLLQSPEFKNSTEAKNMLSVIDKMLSVLGGKDIQGLSSDDIFYQIPPEAKDQILAKPELKLKFIEAYISNELKDFTSGLGEVVDKKIKEDFDKIGQIFSTIIGAGAGKVVPQILRNILN